MNNFLNAIWAALKVKTKRRLEPIRKWSDLNFLKQYLIGKIQTFFENLFEIRPRDKNDYYVIGFWMVSKKLAYTIITLAGALSLLLLLSLKPVSSIKDQKTSSVTYTYRYDALPLRFHKGQVQILAAEGYKAYEGQVDGGYAKGHGKLFQKDGSLLYEGAFEHSVFEGLGQLYYPGGMLKYDGEFSNNLYHGTGTAYWENGSMEYNGGFINGKKSGKGWQYNSRGELIFTGMFSGGNLIYSQMVQKSTQELKDMYTGESCIYTSDTEYCVEMPEIQALYTVSDGSSSLDEGWKVKKIYVMDSSFALGEQTCTTTDQLKALLGEPGYEGYSEITMAEAIGINRIRGRGNTTLQDPGLKLSQVFDEAFEVEGYDWDYDIYLNAFEYEDLIYSFYCDKKRGSFVMYSIEAANP